MKINKDIIIEDSNKTLNDVVSNLTTLFGYGEIQEIVTSGNNVGIKFTNGTLICYGRHATGSQNCNSGWGQIYASTAQGGYTYAVPFIADPACTMNYVSTSMNAWMMPMYGGSTTTTPGWQLLRPTSATVSGHNHYIAVGRWK